MTCSRLLRRKLRQPVQRYVVVFRGILEQSFWDPFFTAVNNFCGIHIAFWNATFQKGINQRIYLLDTKCWCTSVFKEQISLTISQLIIPLANSYSTLLCFLNAIEKIFLWKIIELKESRNSTGIVKEFRLPFILTKILQGKFPLTCKNVNEVLKFWN